MRISRLSLFLALALLAPQALSSAACPRISMAYYTSWSKWTYPSSAIPYSKLTHICHAFLQENADGSLTIPADLLDANLITQAHANGVKVLISVGGASWSGAFPALAASAAARANFANQIEAFCRTYGYDGVDVDWEFPDDGTKSGNFDLLMQDLRNKFNSSAAPAPSWLITSAVSADLYYAGFLHLNTLKNSMSFFNIMSYDYHGPWSNHSGHNAALYPSSMEWGGAHCQHPVLCELLQGSRGARLADRRGPAFLWLQVPHGLALRRVLLRHHHLAYLQGHRPAGGRRMDLQF